MPAKMQQGMFSHVKLSVKDHTSRGEVMHIARSCPGLAL